MAEITLLTTLLSTNEINQRLKSVLKGLWLAAG